jgi:hypothetical protein
VHEAWERQLGRAAAAADRVLTLEQGYVLPGGGEDDRGGEAVRARADYRGGAAHPAPVTRLALMVSSSKSIANSGSSLITS